ncbi:cupredoxin domain-containing protein [Aquitalea pelogenes]|uniref:cupredoxin domain-containing protein n=1 Tax=Aquitalea pelogenes TaxID=1293573 RepID=UPI000786C799
MLKTLAPCVLLVLLAACGKQGAAPAAAPAAPVPAIPVVNVGINDEACEPMQLTVKRGKTQFLIKNNSARAVEWEILKGVYVVEERENIAPGFSQKLTAKLEPGKYEMTCGLLSNPHGVLIVE